MNTEGTDLWLYVTIPKTMIRPFRGIHPQIHPTAYVDPSAQVIGDVHLGEEASIWCNCTVRGDIHFIRIGDRSNLQDNCVIHSGEATTIVEEDCTVGHGAIMEGCVIKRGAIIGMNSTILENTEIGEESLIAAGSVVVPHTKIPPHVLAAGTPAKVKKEIEGEALKWIRMGASTYVELCRSYLGGDYKIVG